MSEVHIAIVGAGVVGLAVAFHIVQHGARVTVIDRDPEGDKASFGNAGAIAVTEVVPASAPGVLWRVPSWMFDPLGPLSVRPAHLPKLAPWLVRFARMGTPSEAKRVSRALAALNARVYDDLLPMLTNVGLATELCRKGALTVYEREEGYRRDSEEWACKRERRIVVEELTAAEAREMEPALGPRVHRAIFTPEWSHVTDPKKIVNGLRRWLLNCGVTIVSDEVSRLSAGSSEGVTLALAHAAPIIADRTIIAAGVWSGLLAKQLGDRVLLESERGYNTTLPNPGIHIERQLIFAERKFVATPLECGLRIGGAAEFGGLRAIPNYERSHTLVELARHYLPELKTRGGTVWAGHRPATPDSLPVISRSPRQPNVYYAFGHGHLGLTQAATTGRLISDLVFRRPPLVDMSPYDIARFSSATR